MTGPAPALKFWSDAEIAGRPRVLAIDATRNANGWETETAAYVTNSLTRRNIPVANGGLPEISAPDDLPRALRSDDHNAIALFTLAEHLPALWQILQSESANDPKLLAVCTWDTADPETAAEILTADPTPAPLAVAQLTPMTGRAAALFFMKFFAEVDLHSESSNSMTGKMTWFGHSKAREILKRRKYEGTVGLRS